MQSARSDTNRFAIMKEIVKVVCIIGSIAVPVGLLGYGWVMNIVKLMSLSGFDGEMAVRIAGIPIVVLGGIAGWF